MLFWKDMFGIAVIKEKLWLSVQVKNEFLPKDASFSIQNGSFVAISLLFSLNVAQNNDNNVF